MQADSTEYICIIQNIGNELNMPHNQVISWLSWIIMSYSNQKVGWKP